MFLKIGMTYTIVIYSKSREIFQSFKARTNVKYIFAYITLFMKIKIENSMLRYI